MKEPEPAKVDGDCKPDTTEGPATTKADSEHATEEDEEKEPTILTKWKKWLNSLVNDVTE